MRRWWIGAATNASFFNDDFDGVFADNAIATNDQLITKAGRRLSKRAGQALLEGQQALCVARCTQSHAKDDKRRSNESRGVGGNVIDFVHSRFTARTLQGQRSHGPYGYSTRGAPSEIELAAMV